MSIICDIPYIFLIYDQTKNSIPALSQLRLNQLP